MLIISQCLGISLVFFYTRTTETKERLLEMRRRRSSSNTEILRLKTVSEEGRSPTCWQEKTHSLVTSMNCSINTNISFLITFHTLNTKVRVIQNKYKSFFFLIGREFLYNVVLVSSVHNVNQSWVYTYLLPLESPHAHPMPPGHHRAGCWLPMLHTGFSLAIGFTHESANTSVLLSPSVPTSASPAMSRSALPVSASLFLPLK